MHPIPYWRLSSFYLFYFALLGSTAPFLALTSTTWALARRASASWWPSLC